MVKLSERVCVCVRVLHRAGAAGGAQRSPGLKAHRSSIIKGERLSRQETQVTADRHRRSMTAVSPHEFPLQAFW